MKIKIIYHGKYSNFKILSTPRSPFTLSRTDHPNDAGGVVSTRKLHSPGNATLKKRVGHASIRK